MAKAKKEPLTPYLVDGVPHVSGVGIGCQLGSIRLNVMAEDSRTLRKFFREHLPQVPYDRGNERRYTLARVEE